MASRTGPTALLTCLPSPRDNTYMYISDIYISVCRDVLERAYVLQVGNMAYSLDTGTPPVFISIPDLPPSFWMLCGAPVFVRLETCVEGVHLASGRLGLARHCGGTNKIHFGGFLHAQMWPTTCGLRRWSCRSLWTLLHCRL